jgi:hypothetical protein
MGKIADDAEFIRQLALQRAQQHDQKAFQNDVEYVEDLIKLQTKKPQDDPLCLPGGPETFQTASADKHPEDVKEEKSDAECKFLYNSITESAAGILVGFKLKCHHPYMDRLPQMEEIVRTYEAMTRLLLHLYELKHNPDTGGEFKARFESCKQVFEELKEGWQELLFCDATARLDR